MQANENIILYNTRIYEEENFSPEEFLRKVKRVKRIRTSNDLAFTFYPTSAWEMERNIKLWEFVNGNTNALNYKNHKYFIVMFPKWLYLFLRYSTQANVIESIATALTGLYAGEPSQRKAMEDTLEPSMLRKVKANMEQHFKEFENFTFIVAEDWKLADDINDDYFEKRKRFISTFDYFFRDHASNPIILPYIYPIFDPRLGKKSMFNRKQFSIRLVNSYFNEMDWKKIVLGNSYDELIRAGSEEEPWLNWKKTFLRENRLRNTSR